MSRTIAAAVLCSLCVVAAPLWAQEAAEHSVEARLLEILRERGVISDAEHAELDSLARELRTERDLESRLDVQVQDLVSRAGDEGARTSYTPGKGFSFESPDKKFRLQVGGRLQVRLTVTSLDDADDDGDTRPGFTVPRARIWFQGHAFEEWWQYKLQLDMAGDEADTFVDLDGDSGTFSSTNRLSEIKDAYFELAKHAAFMLRGGQFKVPYSRHQLTSSGSLEFVDRAITDAAFARARDVGLMVFGTGGGEKGDVFEYYAGVFNGEGENKVNNDEGLLWAARVALNPMGAVKYTETDLKGTDEFRIAVAVNAWLHQDDNLSDDEDDWSLGADVAAFYRGLFVLLEGHLRENGVAVGDDVEITGFLIQAGYMVVPGTFEIALRFAQIDFDNATADCISEYGIAFGYFFADHNLKIQLDVRRIEEEDSDGSEEKEWQVRIQFQIIF